MENGFKRFKASKTLSGIETENQWTWVKAVQASKPLKPFQGLKLGIVVTVLAIVRGFKASKTLSGIETRIIAEIVNQIRALQSL